MARANSRGHADGGTSAGNPATRHAGRRLCVTALRQYCQANVCNSAREKVSWRELQLIAPFILRQNRCSVKRPCRKRRTLATCAQIISRHYRDRLFFPDPAHDQAEDERLLEDRAANVGEIDLPLAALTIAEVMAADTASSGRRFQTDFFTGDSSQAFPARSHP